MNPPTDKKAFTPGRVVALALIALAILGLSYLRLRSWARTPS